MHCQFDHFGTNNYQKFAQTGHPVLVDEMDLTNINHEKINELKNTENYIKYNSKILLN